MPDGIWNARYFGRTPAWHKLGEVFGVNENPDLVEAYTRGRLNYRFGLAEITFQPDPEFYSTNLGFEYSYNGELIPFEDQMVVFRYPTQDDPNFVPVGIVSKDYGLIQNMEIAQFFNGLSKKWRVETVGALGRGETIFTTLDAGEVEIAGEPMKLYYIITDNKIGLRQTSCMFAPHMVVCQNTLKTAFLESKLTIDIKHRTGNKEKLEKIATIAEKLVDNANNIVNLFGNMAKVPFPASEFEKMVKEVLYPLPPQPEEGIEVTEEFVKLVDKIKVEQAQVVELYQEYNDTRPGMANTLFGAGNVISDWEGWGKVGRGSTKQREYIFGKRGDKVASAFTYLSKLV